MLTTPEKKHKKQLKSTLLIPGHVFIWNRKTGELVNLLQADKRVVNCVQPHQTLPILATSGIDYNVKIWMPTGEDVFDEQQASDVGRDVVWI